MRKILITGGCGFIGSNLIAYWLRKYPEDLIINADSLTYASRPKFLGEEIAASDLSRYLFRRIDISDKDMVRNLMAGFKPDHVIHLAAESHVCRSIDGPEAFMTTNIMGTYTVLEAFRELWGTEKGHRFHHVSTDEVFGSLPRQREFWNVMFNERSKILPTSPYAASKAASDHIVNCYHHTYGVDTVITNCTNNFGPNQHPEKLIPRTALKILKGEPVIVHGAGDHVRDWIYVEDHCSAIDAVFSSGATGQRYCVGGGWQTTNLEMINIVASLIDSPLKQFSVQHTDDRPTDDERYAVNTAKLHALGWSPIMSNEAKLKETIQWYINRRGEFHV